MSDKNHIYVAIDLKSFYASVECVELGYDPLNTNLVVADESRTEKTICLAVSPALKSFGIPGRPRLFEVIQKVKEINAMRQYSAPGGSFSGESFLCSELKDCPEKSVKFLTAKPRMALYMEYSTKIYNIYLKYIAPEDIHVYSIDEVFMDVTNYLETYGMTPRELTMTMIHDVLDATGITATAGIGTNLYLAKIAMDIWAKHIVPDKDGVRIAGLDEMSYRRLLWDHKPLTDFWRIGRGYSAKLQKYGMYTMGDVARCSVGRPDEYKNENLLYKIFGINAELLIDHAWGYEPCTIADIKSYKPESNSLGSGQVLHCPYTWDKTKLIVREMAELISLELVDKRLVTDQIVMTVGYDSQSLVSTDYEGEVTTDRFGRKTPKQAHGSENLECSTSSSKLITSAAIRLFERITDRNLLIRRVYLTMNHVIDENSVKKPEYEQLDLFTDYDALRKKQAEEKEALEKERSIQETVLKLKKKYGKNAVLKGMNLEEGATTIDRNDQIGGHKA